MALFLDVSTEDILRIGDTLVTLEQKSGKRARIRIEGPAEVELFRPNSQREKQQQPPVVEG